MRGLALKQARGGSVPGGMLKQNRTSDGGARIIEMAGCA